MNARPSKKKQSGSESTKSKKSASSKSPPFSTTADGKPRVRRIGSLISQLMARRGYARVGVNEHLIESITTAVGSPLAASCQVGNLRAGVLQLFVSDSASLQEMNFQKRAILKQLDKDFAGNKITDVRFRIQSS